MRYLITGGCGFIGTSFVLSLLANKRNQILNLDKLSYSSNYNLHKTISSKYSNYFFKKLDICNFKNLKNSINLFKPDIIFHLAAETHVDRSIEDPLSFINTNITGTYNLLEVFRIYFYNSKSNKRKKFKFIHISTDEVYGDLGDTNKFFNELSPYKPSSPYSASKASSDHLVDSWNRTFGLPSIIINCSNNYGPNQFPEKLIPLFINNILEKKPLPVYGDGNYTRDWLYVVDHARAIDMVFHLGRNHETYNIGGFNEWKNIDLVKELCKQMDQKMGKKEGTSTNLITFVKDRPGHDLRYAIDASKIQDNLGWTPSVTFEEGLSKTIDWYLNNTSWLDHVRTGSYQNYNKNENINR